jgi:pSer/pThr/pTyr-binding forkhead associated (FHA) protein
METRSNNVTVTLDFKGRELGRWTVDRPLSVGRTADNDIVIDNLSISRRHAVIEPSEEGCAIRDAGSLNGILVNGVEMRETGLKNGDVITLGKHRIICHIQSSSKAAVVDPALFDPTMMAERDEIIGTIDDPGWLAEVTDNGEVTHSLNRPLILIGSDEAADIIVTGSSIAPYHAEIQWQDGVYTLRHLEGRRAVKVDGRTVKECVLEDGCAIAMGDWACAFHAPVPSNTTG